MRASKNKNGSITYTYKSGTLQKEIDKCEKELEKINQELLFIDELYSRVEKKRNALRTRMKHCIDFIPLAKEKLKETETEK
ncbi:MAG: hypothetical protein ACRCZN_13780 [Lactococcus lactis]